MDSNNLFIRLKDGKQKKKLDESISFGTEIIQKMASKITAGWKIFFSRSHGNDDSSNVSNHVSILRSVEEQQINDKKFHNDSGCFNSANSGVLFQLGPKEELYYQQNFVNKNFLESFNSQMNANLSRENDIQNKQITYFKLSENEETSDNNALHDFNYRSKKYELGRRLVFEFNDMKSSDIKASFSHNFTDCFLFQKDENNFPTISENSEIILVDSNKKYPSRVPFPKHKYETTSKLNYPFNSFDEFCTFPKNTEKLYTLNKREILFNNDLKIIQRRSQINLINGTITPNYVTGSLREKFCHKTFKNFDFSSLKLTYDSDVDIEIMSARIKPDVSTVNLAEKFVFSLKVQDLLYILNNFFRSLQDNTRLNSLTPELRQIFLHSNLLSYMEYFIKTGSNQFKLKCLPFPLSGEIGSYNNALTRDIYKSEFNASTWKISFNFPHINQGIILDLFNLYDVLDLRNFQRGCYEDVFYLENSNINKIENNEALKCSDKFFTNIYGNKIDSCIISDNPRVDKNLCNKQESVINFLRKNNIKISKNNTKEKRQTTANKYEIDCFNFSKNVEFSVKDISHRNLKRKNECSNKEEKCNTYNKKVCQRSLLYNEIHPLVKDVPLQNSKFTNENNGVTGKVISECVNDTQTNDKDQYPEKEISHKRSKYNSTSEEFNCTLNIEDIFKHSPVDINTDPHLKEIYFENFGLSNDDTIKKEKHSSTKKEKHSSIKKEKHSSLKKEKHSNIKKIGKKSIFDNNLNFHRNKKPLLESKYKGECITKVKRGCKRPLDNDCSFPVIENCSKRVSRRYIFDKVDKTSPKSTFEENKISDKKEASIAHKSKSSTSSAKKCSKKCKISNSSASDVKKCVDSKRKGSLTPMNTDGKKGKNLYPSKKRLKISNSKEISKLCAESTFELEQSTLSSGNETSFNKQFEDETTEGSQIQNITNYKNFGRKETNVKTVKDKHEKNVVKPCMVLLDKIDNSPEFLLCIKLRKRKVLDPRLEKRRKCRKNNSSDVTKQSIKHFGPDAIAKHVPSATKNKKNASNSTDFTSEDKSKKCSRSSATKNKKVASKSTDFTSEDKSKKCSRSKSTDFTSEDKSRKSSRSKSNDFTSEDKSRKRSRSKSTDFTSEDKSKKRSRSKSTDFTSEDKSRKCSRKKYNRRCLSEKVKNNSKLVDEKKLKSKFKADSKIKSPSRKLCNSSFTKREIRQQNIHKKSHSCFIQSTRTDKFYSCDGESCIRYECITRTRRETQMSSSSLAGCSCCDSSSAGRKSKKNFVKLSEKNCFSISHSHESNSKSRCDVRHKTERSMKIEEEYCMPSSSIEMPNLNTKCKNRRRTKSAIVDYDVNQGATIDDLLLNTRLAKCHAVVPFKY